MPPQMNGRGRRQTPVRCAAVGAALALGGCASTITTPLPELPNSHVSSSMSQQDRKKAMEDLGRARDTHEQDAEKQIESSR